MEHLAVFIIVAVVCFWICIHVWGNEKTPTFNENPIIGYIGLTILIYLTIELLTFAIKILIL